MIITNNLVTGAIKPVFQYTRDFKAVCDNGSHGLLYGNNVPVNDIVSVINETGKAYNVISVNNGNYYILKRVDYRENLFVTKLEIKREVSNVSCYNRILKYYSYAINILISLILLSVAMSITKITPIPKEVYFSLILFLSIALISFIIDKGDYKKNGIKKKK
jgi:hypothetical protein